MLSLIQVITYRTFQYKLFFNCVSFGYIRCVYSYTEQIGQIGIRYVQIIESKIQTRFGVIIIQTKVHSLHHIEYMLRKPKRSLSLFLSLLFRDGEAPLVSVDVETNFEIYKQ